MQKLVYKGPLGRITLSCLGFSVMKKKRGEPFECPQEVIDSLLKTNPEDFAIATKATGKGKGGDTK